MRTIIGFTTAICLTISGGVATGIAVVPVTLAALSATTTDADAAGRKGARHHKGARHKGHDRSRKSRNTRTTGRGGSAAW